MQVLGARILTAKGDTQVISDFFNTEWLPAVSLSLGALGIILDVTIEIQPITYLKRTTEMIPINSDLHEMYETINALHRTHERMTAWGPHMIWNRTTSSWTMEPFVAVTYWELTDYQDINNCSTYYCEGGRGFCMSAHVCYDDETEALNFPLEASRFSTKTEHFIPDEYFVDAATAYTSQILEQAARFVPLNNRDVVFKFQFVKSDEIWMSPANNHSFETQSGIFATIEMDWRTTFNNPAALLEYQAFADELVGNFEFHARPHWGTATQFSSEYTQTVYPKVDDFAHLHKQLDPYCQFVNPFLIQHLGLTYCDIDYLMPTEKRNVQVLHDEL